MDVMNKHLLTGALLASALYGTRRVFRNWGATKEESRSKMPGDTMVSKPVFQTTAAITVQAEPCAVWASLTAELTDSDDVSGRTGRLLPGDSVRFPPLVDVGFVCTAAAVVDVDPERSLVLRAGPDTAPTVCSVVIAARWTGSTRLILRMRSGLRHPGQVFVRELEAPLIGLSVHSMLGAIKASAEKTAMVLTDKTIA
ncbi:hypothetical protein ABIA30_004158 [Mycobacterium sp. MAA66]|uniref:hypothetical protein n=1 Tax=Mycobacterium sp. MAA66 TaxID=3156297 RepID=UPI003515C991